MLIIVQFPLTDIRQFVVNKGVLLRPSWPTPIPDKEFVRNIGIVRSRKKNGVSNWVGENEICTATQAIKFESLGKLRISNQETIIKILFRRFYSDGIAFNKFEIGFDLKFPKKHPIYHLNKNFLQDFLSGVIVSFPNLRDAPHKYKLADAGKYLAQLYLASSTSTNIPLSEKDAEKVIPSKPIIYIVEGRKMNHRNIPLLGKEVKISREQRFQMSYHLLTYNGQNISTFIFSGRLEETRSLRIMILRLHAEIDVLKSILGLIASDYISIKPKSEESDLLQYYLNKTTKNVLKRQSTSKEFGEFDFEAVAFSAIESISPGTRQLILERLDFLDIRKNIFRKVETFTKQITISGNVIGSTIIIGDNNNIQNH